MKRNQISLMTAIVGTAGLLSGCAGSNAPTFSLLPDTKVFTQGNSSNNKVDILWVIDNSGSMATPQANIANNFNSFIQQFTAKSFDYHMGVITTDAWKSTLYNQPTLARLRDGTDATSHTGVFVINPLTPNANNVFMTNITQGIAGSGDERAFSSFKNALDSNLNSDFRRSDAYLAVIIVSDEDDFSANTTTYLNKNYNDSRLIPVQNYVDYLDTLTGTTGATRRYSVSAIAVWTQACLNISHTGASIGQRYGQLVDATNGVKGDICSTQFSLTLEEIENRIAELSTQFYLDRIPIESSIKVSVNGVSVPASATNGWTHDVAANSIMFHGAAIPAQGSTIVVDFDPMTIK